MDYKSIALQGAAAGALASLFFGRGGKSFGKAAKFGAMGAGAAMVGAFVLLDKVRGPGLLAAGDFDDDEDANRALLANQWQVQHPEHEEFIPEWHPEHRH